MGCESSCCGLWLERQDGSEMAPPVSRWWCGRAGESELASAFVTDENARADRSDDFAAPCATAVGHGDREAARDAEVHGLRRPEAQWAFAAEAARSATSAGTLSA